MMTESCRRRLVGLLAGVVLLAAAGPGAAREPLIDFATGQTLVSNLKARQVGDLITIIITETASAKSTSKTKADNKSEVGGGPALGFLDFIKPWELDVENKYQGSGDTQRGGSLRAEITARVTEVLGNGDLRLEGTRMVNINGEKQLIEITGVCRVRDINPDNTIMSTFVSEAQIAYNGSGVVSDAAEPGVVTKIINWLF
ncbi:MAG: flagellar basal body L-ring protein FlgH [bacterium]|nr:flagellar basal body L-ring protein FlgH [bacterium]